jgi:hypothetical protein
MGASGQLRAPAALLLRKKPVLIEQEAGWAPEQVWTFWRREKFLTPTGIRVANRPPCRLATIPTSMVLI